MLARIKSSLSIAPKNEKPETPPGNIRPRQSRRLSKPQTNRASYRLSMLQDEEGGIETQTINSLTVEFASGADNALRQATREALRYQLFDSELDIPPRPHSVQPTACHGSEWSGSIQEPSSDDTRHIRTSRPVLNLDVFRTKSMPIAPTSPISGIEPDTTDDTKHASLLNTPTLSTSPKMYAPIRRSSLLTPGVATRFSRIEFEDADYETCKRAPIIQKQGWEEVAADADLDVFEWQLPKFVERASTPSDLDVPHIGTIDIGALRITNGCPSPVPSESATLHSRQLSGGLDKWERGEDRTTPAATLASSMLRNQVLGDRIVPSLDTTKTASRRHDEAQSSLGFPEAPSHPPPPPPIQLDDSAAIARENASELPLSPFSESEQHRGPLLSPLEVTTKATELEDNLFEDDVMEQPSPEAASAPSASLLAVPATRPAASRASTERSLGKSDSGYSSSSSVYSARETRRAKMKQYLQTQHIRSRSTLTTNELQKAKLIEEPSASEIVRPPLLQPASATSNVKAVSAVRMNESTQSFATYDSSVSLNTLQKSKARRLQKKRPEFTSRMSSSITVQSQDNLAHVDIPPVPAHISRNLSERATALPELDRTYSNVNKDNEGDASRTYDFEPVEIRFPSPVDWESEKNTKSRSKDKSSSSRPLYKRFSSSFLGRNKSSKSETLPGQCDHETAVAIIENSASIFDPEEARFRRVLPVTRPSPIQRHSYAGVSPFTSLAPIEDEETDRRMTMTGMDAQTAARLARTRSKSLADRQMDALNAQHPGFNDRGGIPGRQLRPMSTAMDAPPMPPLPDNIGRYHIGNVSQDVFSHAKSRPKSTPPQAFHDASFSLRMNANSKYGPMASDEAQPTGFRASLPHPDRRPPPPPIHSSPDSSALASSPYRQPSPAPAPKITRPKSTIGVRALPPSQHSSRDNSRTRPSSITENHSLNDMNRPSSSKGASTSNSNPSRPRVNERRSLSQHKYEQDLRPGSSGSSKTVYHRPTARVSGGYSRSEFHAQTISPVGANWQSVY